MNEVYLITASFVGEIKRDFEGYLDMAHRAGYQGLETFNFPFDQYTPEEMLAVLAKYDLKTVSAHLNIDDTTDELLEYLPKIGVKYLVCPGIHVESEEDAYKKAELLNEMGRKAKAHGMKYGYHNHNNDFDRYGDKTVIEIFLENTDPDLVTFELDAAWAWRAGVNAAEFINQHAGRFELIHVKETSRVMTKEDQMPRFKVPRIQLPDGRMVPDFSQLPPEAKAAMEERRKINCKLGDGIINMPEIKKAADAQGVKYYIVEREYAYTGDNFTTILEDRQYLAGI